MIELSHALPSSGPAAAQPAGDGRLPGDVHWYDLPDDEAEEDPGPREARPAGPAATRSAPTRPAPARPASGRGARRAFAVAALLSPVFAPVRRLATGRTAA